MPTKAALNWLLASTLVAHSTPSVVHSSAQAVYQRCRPQRYWHTPPNGPLNIYPTDCSFRRLKVAKISVEVYPSRVIRRGLSVEVPLGHGVGRWGGMVEWWGGVGGLTRRRYEATLRSQSQARSELMPEIIIPLSPQQNTTSGSFR